ncbi:putative gas1-like protein [Diaporthe ampelina]|uniref:Putative gas1-like protein n=1 Tax=Diaporthe ampelina TaxID=1214573 RepID=A0A0G2FBL1_9PEZI|nr:putative gas1-like protein [Diaporthe ampelina]
MSSLARVLLSAAFASLVHGHSQILNVQGEQGSPASVGFLVESDLARNCTSISPCQQDATIIRDAEITSNIVNECGRTELGGNIDVGENTENALAANAVTQVSPGGEMTVTIHQVNADGAGPYTCDLDPTGNSLGATGQIPLEVTNNVPGANGFSQAKTVDFNMTVKMPADMNCTGASTGNVCTVRCRNNALAGPFGGCFAVQQAGGAEKTNVASKIETTQTLDGVEKQIAQNKEDLAAAVAANQQAGSEEGLAADQSVKQVLNIADPVIKEAPTQTPIIDLAEPTATQASSNNAQTQSGNGRQRGGKNGGNADAATGNANAATGATTGQGQGRQRGGNKNNNNKRTFGRWVGRQLADLRQ